MAIRSFFRAWVILAKNNLQNQLLTSASAYLFIIGKLFNFIFSILIITAVFHQSQNINGYTYHQGIIFVLVFNVLDSLTQFFFRALYSFRPVLVRGDFDLDLLKPLPAFFRPIFSAPDFLDVPIIVIKIIALFYFIFNYHLTLSIVQSLLFFAIFLNSILIAFSLHLIIAAFSIITTEIDSLVGLYRSLNQTAVIPTDIYHGAFRFLLDYIIPVTIIFSLPAKALLNLLTPNTLVYLVSISLIFFFFSLYFWHFSLRRYTST